MATSVTDKIITAILFIFFKKSKIFFLNYKIDNTELMNG